MTKKNIILTFDYELFLGRNLVSSQEVLVNPTSELLAKLNESAIKATFFVDLTYLLCMHNNLHHNQADISKNDTQLLADEYNCVLENIDDMLLQGHEIGIHFHPQWKDAVYEDGKWGFSTFEHYALHNLTKDEIDELFATGVKLFHELHQRTNTALPRNISFRAGGWCIHPFEYVSEKFVQHGITIDSSVTIPFNRTPFFYPGEIPTPKKQLKHRSSWRFSADPLIEDKAGKFTEVPIDICFSSLLDLIKAQSKSQPGNWKKRGTFIPTTTGIRKKLLRVKKILNLGEHTMLTLDVENAAVRFSQFHKYMNQTKTDKGFVFLSHPKQFGGPSMEMIDRLVECGQYKFLRLSDYINLK
jgi:hypothetical protein